MFGIIVIDILFFALPAILLVFLGISIYRYVSAKRKSAKEPGTVSPSDMKSRKIVLIIASILAGVFLAIVVGMIALIFLAVAYM